MNFARFRIVILAALLGCSMQVGALASGIKIGVVNMTEVFEKSKQSQKVAAQLKKEFTPREQEITSLIKGFQDKTAKFQKDSAILSEVEKNKQERELVNLQRDLQRLQNEFREDYGVRDREEMEKMLSKINKVMQQLGKEDNFNLIIRNDLVAYSEQTFDVTSKIIAKLDNSDK